MKLVFDAFERWVRERSSGCMEPSELDELCKGDMDIESGEYVFRNPGVQGQWEAWQASTAEVSVKHPLDEKLEGIRYCIVNGHEEDAHEHIIDLLRGLRVKSKADAELTREGLALKALWKSDR